MSSGLVAVAAAWVDFLIAESVLAAVVFVIVAALAKVLDRSGPSLQRALWSLVLIRLVLPPSLSQPLSLGSVVESLLASAAGSHSATGPLGDDGQGAFLPISGHPPLENRSPESPWAPVAGVLWLTGVGLVGGHHLRRRLHVHRLLRASSPASDLRVLAIADSWRRHLGVRRRVRVLISDREAAPFTVGLLRPVIYLPSLVVADDRCLEPAIAHEMAHVARWDALWLGVERALAVLYFFHPLVHVAARRVDEARERLCDAEVVSRGRLARRAYAGGLVDVLRLDLKVAGMPTMGARKRRLAVRITDIMSRQRSDRASRATAFTTAALAGAFLLPLAGGTADSAAVSEPAAAAVIVSAHLQLDNPVPGSRVSWRWGPGRDPFNGKEVVHRGFDLAAEAGTAVRAPAEGTVVVATEDFEAEPAAGTVIIIDHGSGITTRYTHLGTLEVHQGQRVQRGDVIAGVGSTGRSTGPHVHFEVRVDDEPVDPADFVAEW